MKLTDQINNFIDQYSTTALEAENLGTLQELRKELVCGGYKLGLECAKAKRGFDAAYAKRKIEYFRSKEFHLKDNTGVVAETKAERDIEHLRDEEKTLEGTYGAYRIVLTQVNEVVGSLTQDISILKTEKINL